MRTHCVTTLWDKLQEKKPYFILLEFCKQDHWFAWREWLLSSGTHNISIFHSYQQLPPLSLRFSKSYLSTSQGPQAHLACWILNYRYTRIPAGCAFFWARRIPMNTLIHVFPKAQTWPQTKFLQWSLIVKSQLNRIGDQTCIVCQCSHPTPPTCWGCYVRDKQGESSPPTPGYPSPRWRCGDSVRPTRPPQARTQGWGRSSSPSAAGGSGAPAIPGAGCHNCRPVPPGHGHSWGQWPDDSHHQPWVVSCQPGGLLPPPAEVVSFIWPGNAVACGNPDHVNLKQQVNETKLCSTYQQHFFQSKR